MSNIVSHAKCTCSYLSKDYLPLLHSSSLHPLVPSSAEQSQMKHSSADRRERKKISKSKLYFPIKDRRSLRKCDMVFTLACITDLQNCHPHYIDTNFIMNNITFRRSSNGHHKYINRYNSDQFSAVLATLNQGSSHKQNL